ncbi:MAG: hypothetical protein CMQ51_00330 [Gammaproteobacteria bacterium]|nr:hypothetical protein [Gammaproteobacteria bacterium]
MDTNFILAVVALFCGGITAFFSKVAGENQLYSPSYMIVQAISFVVFAVVIHFIERQPFEITGKTIGIGLISGLFAGVATISSLIAFARGGQGSILFPVVSLGVVVSVGLSFVFYNEPITTTKVIGIGLGVGSILFLSR